MVQSFGMYIMATETLWEMPKQYVVNLLVSFFNMSPDIFHRQRDNAAFFGPQRFGNIQALLINSLAWSFLKLLKIKEAT
jgi:hypothetical protein